MLTLHGRKKACSARNQSRNPLVLSNHDSHKPRASREHLKQLPAPSLQPPASSGSTHWQPPRRLESIAISEVPGCRI
ncbi:hypothetical protein BDW67DRAFT_44793 [Aspergillus spinulosporus]